MPLVKKRLDLPLHPKQRSVIESGQQEVLYGGAAGGGKMLSLDTELVTPTGFTLLKDLKEGDSLLDEQGIVCQVTQLHPIDISPKSYRLTFDNGRQIEACADHQWLTFDNKERGRLVRLSDGFREKRRAGRPSRAKQNPTKISSQKNITLLNQTRDYHYKEAPSGSIRTTQQIYDTLKVRGRTNHSIPVAKAIELPELELPLDPYCLGAWLGDGSKKSGQLTGIDPEVWEQFEKAGFKVTHSPTKQSRHHVYDLIGVLKKIGVANNKHVPTYYLRASIDQRLALLQGLMDTDGTCDKDGSAAFNNTNKSLAEAVYDLVSGLGWKAHWKEGRAKLYGKDCGAKYEVRFAPDKPVFRIVRKLNRQKFTRRSNNRNHYIIDCQPIDPIPMRCISVNSPSHLFLASKSYIPTHNSHLARVIAIMFCTAIAGFQMYLFRRTYKDLYLSHYTGPTSFRAMLSEPMATKDVTISDLEIRFSNGSAIHGCHCQFENDVYSYKSVEMHGRILEEATEFTPFQIQYIGSRARVPKSLKVPPHLAKMLPFALYPTNPGGDSHDYLIDEFDVLNRQNEPFVRNGKRRIFIPARMQDNPDIDEEAYTASLKQLRHPDIVRALLYGDWTVKLGALLPELSERIHVVKHFEPPEHWTRRKAFDWGSNAPAAAVWAAVSDGETYEGVTLPRGALYIYKEWLVAMPDDKAKGLGYTNKQLAEGLRSREDDAGGEYLTDSLPFQARGGVPMWQEFADEGITLSKADVSSKEISVQAVRQLAKGNGEPMLYFSDECPDTLRCLQALRPHNKNPEKPADHPEDHLPDCVFHIARDWWSAVDLEEPITERINRELNRKETLHNIVDYDNLGIYEL